MIRKAALLLLVVGLTALAGGCGGEFGEGDQKGGETTSGGERSLQPIEPGRAIYGTSFVSPLVQAFGEVYIGEKSFIADNTRLRADEGRRIEFGNEINAQDNVTIRALRKASDIRNQTSLAHHAIVEDSKIGDFAFIGFNAQVRNATLGDGAFILHGARVENVDIPQNRIVAAGQVVTDQDTADSLPEAPEATEEFRREVLDVNEEFAENYIDLYEREGEPALLGVGPNPQTSFNQITQPQVPNSVTLGEFVRVVGDVRMGRDSEVGERTAIRADEGSPIIIGNNADIGERVTFHALGGTEMRVGDRLVTGDDVVLHGPLEVGNNLTVGDRGVVFRVRVGNNVTVGEGATIAGSASEGGEQLELEIPDGANIPAGAVVTNQQELDAILGERGPVREQTTQGQT